jgi:serine/threonine-protein kinase
MTTDALPGSVESAARDAASRAVEYGPDLAEAQYALAYVRLFIDWEPRSAEEAARRAVALDPNNALGHLFLGVVLSHERHFAEALASMQRARELDPLFSHTFALSSMVAADSGDFPAALEFAKQAVAINPAAWVGYLHLGNANMGLGKPAEALEAFAASRRLSGDNSKTDSSIAWAQTALGRVEEARAILVELEREATERYVPPYAIAVVHAVLGDTDAAFDWLDRAVSERDVHLLGLPTDAPLAPLHSDPRFGELLARCGCTSM